MDTPSSLLQLDEKANAAVASKRPTLAFSARFCPKTVSQFRISRLAYVLLLEQCNLGTNVPPCERHAVPLTASALHTTFANLNLLLKLVHGGSTGMHVCLQALLHFCGVLGRRKGLQGRKLAIGRHKQQSGKKSMSIYEI